MSQQIDWAKLVSQGRAKDMGIPWTEDELKAIYEYKIDPDDVRAGILTPEDKVRADKKDAELKSQGKVNYERMKKSELEKLAKGLGIEFESMSVTKSGLIAEIKKAQESKRSGEGNS